MSDNWSRLEIFQKISKYLKILPIYGLKRITVIAVIHDDDNSTLHFTVHIFIDRIKSKIISNGQNLNLPTHFGSDENGKSDENTPDL